MISPEQCRSARAWLDWSQEELAARANVSLSTVRDFEKGRRIPIANNITAIAKVLSDEGLVPEESAGEPGGIRFVPRIKEHDTYLPTLRLLADAPGGFLKMTELISALTDHFAPSGGDVEILAGRSDTRFSQIVRNIVSHQNTPTNPIGRGWMEHDKAARGLRITPLGRKHLSQEP